MNSFKNLFSIFGSDYSQNGGKKKSKVRTRRRQSKKNKCNCGKKCTCKPNCYCGKKCTCCYRTKKNKNHKSKIKKTKKQRGGS